MSPIFDDIAHNVGLDTEVKKRRKQKKKVMIRKYLAETFIPGSFYVCVCRDERDLGNKGISQQVLLLTIRKRIA